MGEQTIQPGQETNMSHSDATDDSDTAMVNSNLVDWDGPDDPENPMNWSKSQKALFITTLGYISTLRYGSLFNLRKQNHTTRLHQY